MQRFFVDFHLSIDLLLEDADLVRQLTRVLRVRVGESIILFDGDGSETVYEIREIQKKSISLRGIERNFPQTEGKKQIFLYQALPNKYEKIEYILQKGVEVGIRKFLFFRSDFSQKLMLSPSKKDRFRVIAREALEQCGGLVMPEIEFLDSFDAVCMHLGRQKYGSQEDGHVLGGRADLVLDTLGKTQKIQEISQEGTLGIWVGPEGGWSEKEREKMGENGFIFVRFGERVLRTETAGVVSAFSLLHT